MSGNQQNIDALARHIETYFCESDDAESDVRPLAEHLAQAGVLDPSVMTEDQTNDLYVGVASLNTAEKAHAATLSAIAAIARGDV